MIILLHKVYVAIKQRMSSRNKHDMGLMMIPYDEAELQQREIDSEVFHEKLKVKTLVPPSLATTEIPLTPVHVLSPSCFYILYGDPGELETSLASCGPTLKKITKMREVVRGETYLMADEEARFNRVRVEFIASGQATVFLMDFGILTKVDASELLVISEEAVAKFPSLLNIPGLALHCRIAGIQPKKTKSCRGLWNSEVVARFQDLLMVDGAEPEGKIYSVIKYDTGQSKVVVALETLTVQIEGERKDVKSTLIEEHLAEKAVEPYNSQKNHKDREQFGDFDPVMQDHLNKQVLEESGEVSVGAPGVNVSTLRQSGRRLPLAGPFSPLEHKVVCLHRQGSGKLATVDPESVNSVMLNQAPGEMFDQFMVAAQVGVNPSGETLVLRGTSWLPASPGFGALATMIFSPHVELRANPSRTRLSGCLTGLGPKTTKDKAAELLLTKNERHEAFHPEHDVETRFDVEITNEDVNTVNKIRYWMNQCLSKTHPDQLVRLGQPALVRKAQIGVKECLGELMGKDRLLKEKEPLPSRKEYG